LFRARGAAIVFYALMDRYAGMECPLAEVEIYTRMMCGYCVRAKRLLAMRGVDYKEISIDGDQASRATMIERAHGRTTVPQIFINGKHVGGCDDLFEMEQDGKLAELLAA
jgi:glutaredoxin 3